jgi:hypothetical protein
MPDSPEVKDALPAIPFHLVTSSAARPPYVVYGFGGTANDLATCNSRATCAIAPSADINNSHRIPLPAGRVDAINPQAWYSPMTPAAAACTACHTLKSTAAHTQLNTSPGLGEACEVCHGPNGQFSVDREHARTL